MMRHPTPPHFAEGTSILLLYLRMTHQMRPIRRLASAWPPLKNLIAAEVDYWEEVPLEEGGVCFFNHTSQEYSSSLPSDEAITPTDRGPADAANGSGPQPAGTAGSGNEGQLGVWEGQMWDGIDGEVFVPWPEEESQAIMTSPEAAGGPSDEVPDTPEGTYVLTVKTAPTLDFYRSTPSDEQRDASGRHRLKKKPEHVFRAWKRLQQSQLCQ